MVRPLQVTFSVVLAAAWATPLAAHARLALAPSLPQTLRVGQAVGARRPSAATSRTRGARMLGPSTLSSSGALSARSRPRVPLLPDSAALAPNAVASSEPAGAQPLSTSLLIGLLALFCISLQAVPVLACAYVGTLAAGADVLPMLDGTPVEAWLFGEALFSAYTAYVLNRNAAPRTAGASTPAAVRSPEITPAERALLWQRCLRDATISAEALAVAWTRPANGTLDQVRRADLEAWVCWGVMGRVPAELSGEEAEELARYVRQFEQQIGRELPPGDPTVPVRPMRTTIEPLNVMSRPLLAYVLTDLIIGQVATPLLLRARGFGGLERAGRFGFYHAPARARAPPAGLGAALAPGGGGGAGAGGGGQPTPAPAGGGGAPVGTAPMQAAALAGVPTASGGAAPTAAKPAAPPAAAASAPAAPQPQTAAAAAAAVAKAAAADQGGGAAGGGATAGAAKPPPVVFVHGVGIGPISYLQFIAEMQEQVRQLAGLLPKPLPPLPPLSGPPFPVHPLLGG